MIPPNNLVTPRIRLAFREDVPLILSLSKELADFEQSPDSVQATESDLASTLTFAPSPHQDQRLDTSTAPVPTTLPGYGKVLIMYLPLSRSSVASHATSGPGNEDKQDNQDNSKDEQIVGMAIFYYTYSAWLGKPGVYLEDLFIRPTFRRRGYARLLLQELAKEVQRIGGVRLEWTCLHWNEGALKFYETPVEQGGCGAVRKTKWVGLRVEGEGIGKLAEGLGKVDETSA